MSGGMPELGSKISLISKADIRYEGRLYTVDPQECTIALSSVRSFGTEDRETQFQIAPQSQIYDYILFRGSDIKDIRVVNNSLPHPNDPAIMQVQLPNGQHLMPHFPMPSMNPPHAPPMGGAAYGNPFGIGGLAGMGGAGAAPSLAPGTGGPAPYMLGNQQQPPQPQQQQQQQPPQQQKSQQQQQQKQPSELLLSSNNNSNNNQQQQQQQAQPHQQQQQSIHHNASASIIPSKQAQLPNDSTHSLAQIGQLTQQAGNAVGTGDTGTGSGGIIVGGAGGGGGSGVGGLLSGLLGSGAVAGLGAATNAKKLIPHAALNEHKDQDMLAGASRSTTPMSLISRKSPSADMGVQVSQQPSQPHHNQNNQHQNNAAGHGGNSRDAGHKRQNHQQRGGNRGNNNGTGNGNEFYQQRDRRDSGRNMDNYNNQHHDARNNYNNQRNHQGSGGGGGGGGGGSGGGGQNRGWTMHRGPNNTNNMMMRNRGGGGRGRMQNQGYRPMGGAGGNQNKPRNAKNTIKFDHDFDFEQANNKFEELRSQLSKLKVGEEPKSEQMNGEVDKKDDSGNETGAGEHEPEDEDITVGYDKTKSFFDNISCEAAQDRTKNKKNDWRQERKLNSETFGVSSTRRGSYRGRGNYYNRNVGNYGGGYNRNYRGGNNYRNRTRNTNAANNNGAASTTNTTAAAAAANGSNNNANGTASTNTAAALKNQAQQPQSATSATATAGGAAVNATKSTPSETISTPQQISAGGAGQ